MYSTLPCAFPLANGVYLYVFLFLYSIYRLPYRWFCRPIECFRFVRMLVIPTGVQTITHAQYRIILEILLG